MVQKIIIAGAGPAGCYLGSLLASSKADASITILERSRSVLVKDSGMVSEHIFDFFQRASLAGIVGKEISSIALHSTKHTLELERNEPFAFILDRDKFGRKLRKTAEKNGCRLVYENIEDITRTKGSVAVTTNKGQHVCDLIIGADGANSVVRKALVGSQPKLYQGILTNIKSGKRKPGIDIFFNKEITRDFFAWRIFDEYGVLSSDKMAYHRFLEKYRFKPGRVAGSLVPIGLIKSYSDRCLLVGDAAAQVKPVTGGGIVYSLTCAHIAADVLKNAVVAKRYDAHTLSQYENAWRKRIGNEVRLGLLFRKLYDNMSQAGVEHMFRTCGKDLENAMFSAKHFDYDKPSALAKNMFANKPAKLFLNGLLSLVL